MAVKIRLARRGRKNLAIYDIVVADARAPRDGKFIEKLGSYNPNTDPATIILNEERALKWLFNGALPTDTARSILSKKGVMLRKHLQIGVMKGAITQEEADKRYNEWLAQKQSKLDARIQMLNKTKSEEMRKKQEAEALVNKKREEAIKLKNKPAEASEENVSQSVDQTNNDNTEQVAS
jgi:small subunit ribosomal protein S16